MPRRYRGPALAFPPSPVIRPRRSYVANFDEGVAKKLAAVDNLHRTVCRSDFRLEIVAVFKKFRHLGINIYIVCLAADNRDDRENFFTLRSYREAV